jgi:cytochrome c553
MRRVFRFAGFSLLFLMGLVVIAYAVIYLLSNRAVERRYPVPVVTLAVPRDAASIAEGERLATVRGCYLACHGTKGAGSEMLDDFMLGHINAPNLYQAAQKYSDSELAGLIRDGLRPDGQGVLIMPSQTFHGLNDQDLGRIIAFMRTLPASSGPARREQLGPVLRAALAAGKIKTAPEQIAALVPLPPAPGDGAQLGRYIATTSCTECHGNALEGNVNPEFTSPDLHIVRGYSLADFRKLMREGVALGNREVGLMSEIAKLDLSHLTDAEIDSLYSYLHDFGSPASQVAAAH